MFKVDDVSIAYGSLQAVWDATFDIQERELVTIVGSNGSGKSSILKTISGLMRPLKGSVIFRDHRIDELLPNKIVSLGIVQVPEGRRLFPEMTVLENLELGAYDKTVRDGKKKSLRLVFDYFPVLEGMSGRMAGTLSGGEQQMLAIGRGLMAKPKLLMLDEPSLGLAPMIVKEMFRIIQRLNQEGVPILLVEQNVRYSLRLANRAFVLESGRIIMSGKGEELLENEDIRKAYLAG